MTLSGQWPHNHTQHRMAWEGKGAPGTDRHYAQTTFLFIGCSGFICLGFATRLGEIGVVADNEGVLAAELQHHRRQCGCSR